MISKAEALRSVMEEAYEEASAGLGFAPVRMTGYAARRLVEVRYGIPADTITLTHNGDLGYALRSLKKTNAALAETLNITKKARGSGYEPHTRARVEFGTLEVEQYVRRWRGPGFDIDAPTISQGISTWGPKGLYQGVLVVEKDGLLEFIRRAGIAERYDLMVAASEGQGTEALRELIAAFSLKQLPAYLLHDYDLAGVQIAAALSGRDTKSWEWGFQPNVIDLGIHFADIAPWKIQDESVSGEDDFVPLLRELGCSEEEIGYLVAERWEEASSRKNRRGKAATFWSGRRAELNGLIGQNFIDYIEAKLDALEIGKLMPTDEWLQATYSRISTVNALNQEIDELVSDWDAEEREAPADLRERLTEKLRRDRDMPWDLALADLMEEEE